MAIKIYDINLQKFISVLKDCHLCGSSFVVSLEDSETICPECKKIWKEFVESRNMNLGIKTNKDMELKEND